MEQQKLIFFKGLIQFAKTGAFLRKWNNLPKNKESTFTAIINEAQLNKIFSKFKTLIYGTSNPAFTKTSDYKITLHVIP